VAEMLGNGSDVADRLRFIPIVNSIGSPTMPVQGMTVGEGRSIPVEGACLALPPNSRYVWSVLALVLH